MWQNDAVVRRRPECAWQDVNGKVVVVTGATRRIHILDGCGPALWLRLAQPQRVEALACFLQETYDVDAARAHADLQEFLASLARERLIEATGPGMDR